MVKYKVRRTYRVRLPTIIVDCQIHPHMRASPVHVGYQF
jgi:hypothetical protein